MARVADNWRADYIRERGRLLQAAAWNAYVALRGLNAQDGLKRWKENQQAMAELRRRFREVGAIAPQAPGMPLNFIGGPQVPA